MRTEVIAVRKRLVAALAENENEDRFGRPTVGFWPLPCMAGGEGDMAKRKPDRRVGTGPRSALYSGAIAEMTSCAAALRSADIGMTIAVRPMRPAWIPVGAQVCRK